MISTYLFLEKECNLTTKQYINYIWKRIKRLVFPTWIFLTFYFITIFLVTRSLEIKQIISSYALDEGIGYVWIIRIYLIVAALLPLLQYGLYKNKRRISYTYIVILIIYTLYEIMCTFKVFNNNIVNYLFAYIIPVALIVCTTHWIKNKESKKVAIFSIINFIIFEILGYIIYKITGEIHNTNYMKYPFRMYYLSYAFAISGIIIIVFRSEKIVNFFSNKFIEFVSMHSLWIYLWHIIFVKIFDYINYNINWFIKYIIVICGALLITYAQNKIIDYLEKKKINKEVLIIFNG